MGDAAKKIVEAAMELPEDERLHVVSVLWASVSSEADDEWEKAWAKEIESRLADPRPSISWEEARVRIQQALKNR